MGKLLGGSQTSRTQLPRFIEEAGQRAVDRAEQAGRIGFVPYGGPEVAAFTPMQEAAFAGTNQAASAFGLPTAAGTGLPQAQEFAGGVRGFSSMPLFEQALAELQATRPGQFEAIQSFFIDPVTGAPAGGLLSAPSNPSVTTPGVADSGAANDQTRGFAGTGTGGGFTGLRDMFNGGGPGQSGDQFSGGGLLSDLGNRFF